MSLSLNIPTGTMRISVSSFHTPGSQLSSHCYGLTVSGPQIAYVEIPTSMGGLRSRSWGGDQDMKVKPL